MISLDRQYACGGGEIARGHSSCADQWRRASISGYAHILKDEAPDKKIVEVVEGIE